MRLEDLLAAHALRTPDKPALICGPDRIGYAELLARSRALAAGLGRAGVGVGDRVALYLPNGAVFAEALFAVFALGAIAVPVNTRNTPRELAYFVRDSGARVLMFHAEQAAALEDLRSGADHVEGLVHVACGGPVAGALEHEALARPCDERLAALPLGCDDAMILYTSGTTGQPKGALITHANCVVQHGYLNAVDWGIDASDVYLVTTPLAHRIGLARLMNSICLGGTLVLMARFDPADAVALIEAEGVTAAGMVPTVARLLLPVLEQEAARCTSLRHLIVTGEAFPIELKRRLIELLPRVQLHSFFAMTEVGSVTSLTHEEQFTHPASVGRVTPGLQARLVDEHGREVSVGEVGELLVRSGEPGRFTTMRGYFNRPEATAATIVDGWVRTGDMARFDTDGYLYIVDRKKDMVLSGGFNIYTKEVEQVLAEHPAVADAAVIGVPDALYGEAVTAYVELKPGATLDTGALQEHCRQRIAGYKKPRRVVFVETLPRNGVGKVLKAELRRRAAQERAVTEPDGATLG